MTRTYLVGMHDDPGVLDNDAAVMSAETLLDEISEYCERRARSEFSECEL
jgi:hypothetical protein